MKKNVPKTIRKTVISIVVLLLLFVGGGAAYVYFSGRSTNPETSATPVTAEETSPIPKPVAPGANAPEGVAVGALTTPVKIGSNASLNVTTNAGSKCTVTVTYSGVASTDSGLGPKTADAYGNVTWTWTVATTTPVGSWPVKVTCIYNGRSAVVVDSQVVTK